MKIFSTTQFKELDQYTTLHEPISSTDLMERASMEFVRAFRAEVSSQQRIIVFAGPGNNGGDALAIARLLIEIDYNVEIYLFNPKNKISSDCETNKDRLLLIPDVTFFEVNNSFSPPVLGKTDIVIDGLFGSGLNQPLSGGFASVVQYINQSKATVFSIDIPSGLFGEDNTSNIQENIIRANRTFTFQSPKLAFFLPENGIFTGEWDILNIGLHQDILENTTTPYNYTEEKNIIPLIPTRSRFDHKGHFGHSLLIAGSYGKMGAVILAAKACMKSGAGLLTTYIPECGYSILQTGFPETMVLTDRQTKHISNIPELNPYNAIAIGPGIGLHAETSLALQQLLQNYHQPLVLDADALNLIAQSKYLLEILPKGSILTPHPKELDRLVGESDNSFQRLQKAIDLASNTQCYIILKGAFTAICTPDRNCYFNPTGNPGMATAGSGDVLTGILLGLLSQSYPPFEAAITGVYLHGFAGDLAAEKDSQESLIASNIIKNIGKAFKHFQLFEL